MSARAWQTRRTKKGLAHRCYAKIQKQMERDKDKPLPRTYKGRGPGGLRLTVTIGMPDDFDREDDYWEDDVWPDSMICEFGEDHSDDPDYIPGQIHAHVEVETVEP